MIDFEQCLAVLDYGRLVEHLRVQHTQPPAAMTDAYLSPGDDRGLLIRPAWAPGHALGAKLATIMPGNVDVPAVHALYVLFNDHDGTTAAVMDGLALTWFKTACDSALGSSLLARDDVRSMVMVGAGAMAPHLISAHLAVRPSIEHVAIWNRTPSRADELARRLDRELDAVSVVSVDDLAAAVAAADLVSSATMSPEPIILGRWLAEGSHLDLVGAYLPAMREADDEVLTRSRLFVDHRATTEGDIGELSIPLARGVINRADIIGDLYQLCTGSVGGRRSSSDITVFKNGGGGHLDLMVAQFILDRL